MRPSLPRAAPLKNAAATREPEMKQTKKGHNWHFGLKLHVDTDPRGIVHTVTATDATVVAITQLPELFHGAAREVFGDQACWKEDDRQFLKSRGIGYRIKSPARSPAAVEPMLAYDQLGALAHPGLRRARLPRSQAVVRRHQGEISRPPGIWHGRRPCSPWLISTSCIADCCRPQLVQHL